VFWRRPVVVSLCGVVIGAACLAIGSSYSGSASAPMAAPADGSTTVNAAHPNIVVILTDDLDATSFFNAAHFPQFHQLMVERGTSFPNFFVTDSLCCPSRTSILRGQYVHNTGVEGNEAPYGGFQRFYDLHRESSTIATWLHADGYDTALFGKYLNEYPGSAGDHYIPPGWDKWSSPVAGNPYAEYNYVLNVNGTLHKHYAKPSDYLVDVLSNQAADFIATQPTTRPFFELVTPFVPHAPATPAPRYVNALRGIRQPRTPSFQQADVSAEPTWVSHRPLLSVQSIRRIDELYRRRMQTMLSVDDLLGNVFRALKRTHRLANTYVLFTSDNGFHLGQHRLPPGKQTPFDEDVRVPFVAFGPHVPAAHTDPTFLRSIDLAPTIAKLAHASVPSFVDGISFARELRGQAFMRAPTDTLIEHFRDDGATNETLVSPSAYRNGIPPAPKSVDDDAHPPIAGAPTSGAAAPVPPVRTRIVIVPTFRALRTTQYLYVEYSTGERELYDVVADPNELHNLAHTADLNLVALLATRLHQLERCSGVTCRAQ